MFRAGKQRCQRALENRDAPVPAPVPVPTPAPAPCRARLPSPGRRRCRCRCRSLPRRPAAGTPLAHRSRPLPLLPLFSQLSEPVSAFLGWAGRGLRAPSRPTGTELAAALPGARRKSSARAQGLGCPSSTPVPLEGAGSPLPSRPELSCPVPSRAVPSRAAPPVAERGWPCRALNSPGAGPPGPAQPSRRPGVAAKTPPVGTERPGLGTGGRQLPVLGEEGPPARKERRSCTVTTGRQTCPEDFHG